MKKKSKAARVLALCLAIVMILSMSMTAFAVTSSDKETITVNGLETEQSVTVHAYKIIDVNVDNASGQPTYPMYTWADEVADWVERYYPGYIDRNVDNAVKDIFGLDGTVTADEQSGFLESMAAAIRSGREIQLPEAAQQTGKGSVTFADMTMGEYILLTTGGTRVYSPATAEVIPVENKGAWTVQSDEVGMKSETPPIEKDVAEGEDDTVAIGDTVTYQISATVPDYPEGATNLTFYIRDSLGEGFDYSGDTSIRVYETSISEDNLLTAGTDYTVAAPVPDGSTFQINFTDTYVRGKPGVKIYVAYTAVVNEKAFVVDALGNDAFLGLANDPYGDDSYETPTDKDVYTYGIQFDKVDKEGDALSGAEFTLSDAAGTVLTFTETSTGGIYNYDPDSSNTTLTVPQGGSLQVQGLNVGTYTLKETKAPDNCVLPTGVITIVLADLNEDGKLDADTSSATADGTATIYGTVSLDTNKITFDVQNISSDEAGFDLPKTGGMGTLIFTIAGIILMAGAVTMITVIARKKKA